MSTLLNRSSSFNGRSSPSSGITTSHPSNARTPSGPTSTDTQPTPQPHRQLNYPPRSHSSIGTYPHNTNNAARERQDSSRSTASPSSSSLMNASSSTNRSHRNSAIAPSPSLPTNLSAHAESSSNRSRNRLSSALAPSAHDGVFSSISASASMNNLPSSSSATLSPELARSRFRGNLSSPAVQSAGGQNQHARSASAGMVDTDLTLPSFLNEASRQELAEGTVTPSLEAIGLHLLALSPNLTLGRYGQPLCGAVLDGKYLLIGTTFGLDFLPLNRAGNKSSKGGLFERFASTSTSSSTSHAFDNSNNPASSSTGEDVKTRKPISLVKKTRFKQLVVLSERSNVLLAVAGRNDHVRVYALDSLRKLIEKKIKEIDDKEGPPVPVIPPQHLLQSAQAKNKMKTTLGTSGQSSSLSKGKGRASPIPPPLPLSSSSNNYRQHQERVKTPLLSPPPAYVFPDDISNPSTQQYARRRSSATSSGPPTPRYRRSSRPSTADTSRSNNNNNPSRRPSIRSSPIPSPHTSPSASGGGSGGTREFHASSPRALKRGNKSRETLRRGSTSASASSSSSFSPGSVSRRGSAATVTPHTVAALAAGSSSPPLPSSSSSAVPSAIITRRRGSSITMYESGLGGDEIPPTPGLPEVYRREMSYNNLQALEDESYEWVDAPEAPDTEILAEPSIPQDSISPSTSYGTIPMSTSVSVDSTLSSLLSSPPTSSIISSSSQFSGNQYSPSPSSSALQNRNRSTSITFSAMSRSSSSNLSRMQPRSPIAVQEDSQAEDEQEQEVNNDGEASETASQRQKAMRLNSRRVSLAEILRESKMSPTLQGQMSRSTSATGFYGGSSAASPTTENGRSARPMARSATATSNHEEMNSLADFLRAGPPVPDQSKALVRSRTTDSLNNKDKEQDNTKRENANKARMLPRSPVLPSALEERETTLGLLDFMKNGPPGPAPATSSTSESSSSTGGEDQRSARRLSKSSRPKRSGSQNSLAASLSALLPSSFSTTTAEPVPSLSRSPALSSLHVTEPAATPIAGNGESRSRSNSARSGQRSPRLRTMTSPEAEVPNSLITSRAAKRMSLQPRSPTIRNQLDEATDSGGATQGNLQMTRSFSLQEALSAEPEVMEGSPTIPASTSSQGLGRSASSASGGPPTRQRNRKRWSLLEGLRGPGSSPLLPSSSTMPSASSTHRNQSTSPAIPQTGSSSLTPSASQSSIVSLSQQTASALPSTPEVPIKPRPANLEEDSPPFANLVTDAQELTNPDGTTITFTQTDVTSVASGLNSSKNRPSGLGNSNGVAPAGTLEYVKLARTKGSRFIRASETKKRTYLAVLCGEQGERIELFTVSLLPCQEIYRS